MKKILKPQTSNLKPRQGQAMLLSSLALGGIILGATTIAGFIMTYQIRMTTIADGSAGSIFASDAGIECGLYNVFKGPETCPATPGECLCALNGDVGNGSRYELIIDKPGKYMISRGFHKNTRRAQDLFYEIFE